MILILVNHIQNANKHTIQSRSVSCILVTLTMGTYSSGGAGWILLDISITAFTNPVTFSYTLSLERSRLAVGGGLISWGCSWAESRTNIDECCAYRGQQEPRQMWRWYRWNIQYQSFVASYPVDDINVYKSTVAKLERTNKQKRVCTTQSRLNMPKMYI